ncbi:hypothetical protein AMELA_G00198470 [Ameiurus melas]|uniref:Uncharacterized protein n=1 Tax=Ameiurus melas TaxID=219545 RepID=A0A7J6A6G5_AMEME|nr:hypothetical protein AMELA_G00198470 [Ameiurus melas]
MLGRRQGCGLVSTHATLNGTRKPSHFREIPIHLGEHRNARPTHPFTPSHPRAPPHFWQRLRSIPGSFGHKVGYTLDRVPIHRRVQIPLHSNIIHTHSIQIP